MPISSAARRPSCLVDALLAIWEASVRATHHFLSEEDILALKPVVAAGLRAIPSLSILTAENSTPLGFTGVDGSKIEMLFLSPKAQGRGRGRKMITHAVSRLGADRVDVNEQNARGVGFYIHLGFEVVGRSEHDGQGRPFPLLHMQLQNAQPDTPEGYAIRHGEAAHLPRLNGIELAAAGIFPPGFLPESILSDRIPLATLAEASAKARLWVALEGNKLPVGYALLQIREGSALLAQIDVHPAHGRKGLGTALVRRVIKSVRGMGLGELYLTTFACIPWNALFYARLGFTALEPDEHPAFIREMLAAERARGLEHRIAMRLRIEHRET